MTTNRRPNHQQAADLSPPLVIMGPTASGKSNLAIALAERLDGEIISADSMQVYRGLDIGTAKPTPAEHARIPHHLIDLLDPTEAMDAARFLHLADAAVSEIRHRGRRPVVVGGSGLYLHAWLYGLGPLPPGDRELRTRLEGEYAGPDGIPRLRERLAQLDPAAATRCGEHRRRLLRALEVCLITGAAMPPPRPAGQARLRQPVHAWRLAWPRPALHARIAARTDAMLRHGWIAEAESLLRQGLLTTPTARHALGYALIAEHLAGHLDAATLRERLIVATRQYARRQDTWFRHQHPEARLLAMPAGPEEILDQEWPEATG